MLVVVYRRLSVSLSRVRSTEGQERKNNRTFEFIIIASKDISLIWPYLSKNDQRKPFRSLHGLISRHSLRFCKLIWMKFFHQLCRLQMRFPPTNICDRNGVTDNQFSWNFSFRVFYSSWVSVLYWPFFKPDHCFYFTSRNITAFITNCSYRQALLPDFVAEPFDGRHFV